jgi:protein-S-isoprenylcysteine O-methyltransferase Ste14
MLLGPRAPGTQRKTAVKKPLPPTFFLCAIVLAVAIHFVAPWRQVVDAPWRTLGAVPLVIGGALNVWADRFFKLRGATVTPFEESSALITGGPFRFSRDPMYLGMC